MQLHNFSVYCNTTTKTAISTDLEGTDEAGGAEGTWTVFEGNTPHSLIPQMH